MEQKARFILFGLVGVIIICIVFLGQTINQKQQLEHERNNLIKEKNMLESKMEKLEGSLREYENKMSSLNNEIKKVSREKEELQSKYEMANKAKEELVEKLKEARASRPTMSQATSMAAPETNDAYWGSILQAKTDLEMQLGSVRNELKSTLISNEQLQREKSTLELGIKSMRRESEDSKRQMDYNKKIMDRISEELVTEKNDKMKIQESLKVLKNENSTLLRQIENLNSRKIDLDQKLRQIQEDKTSLERKFHEMETLLTDNISQVNELKDKLESRASSPTAGKPQAAERKDSVEHPPIVVRPQGMGVLKSQPAGDFSGRILAINKEGNFVIVDMGEDAGLKLGDAFTVYRDGDKIASLEVIRTSKSVSACDIKKQDGLIKIGDLIK